MGCRRSRVALSVSLGFFSFNCAFAARQCLFASGKLASLLARAIKQKTRAPSSPPLELRRDQGRAGECCA